MAQGSRGRWLRVAATGFGVLICTGLVGCLNGDKPKDTKSTGKQPTPGLPGTPRLDAPGVGAGTGGTGAMNTPKGGQPTNQFTGAGANLQPGGGFAASNQFRPGTTGQNTLTSNPQQPINYGAIPAGGPPTLGAPAQTGVQPAGGPLGMTNPGPGAGGYSASSPPPPPLTDIVPPPPPLYGSPSGTPSGGSGAPPASLGPIEPPAPAPGSTGKGPPLNTTFGGGVGLYPAQ